MFSTPLRDLVTTNKGQRMKKKKINKKKKLTKFQKVMKQKLQSRFSGLKFKNVGDGMTEISFN